MPIISGRKFAVSTKLRVRTALSSPWSTACHMARPETAQLAMVSPTTAKPSIATSAVHGRRRERSAARIATPRNTRRAQSTMPA